MLPQRSSENVLTKLAVRFQTTFALKRSLSVRVL
nr:MAG TPA: hypothetical protein [Caudoviricetes sp.]